jgi:uridine kinase
MWKVLVAHRSGLPGLRPDDVKQDADDGTPPRGGGTVDCDAPHARDEAAATDPLPGWWPAARPNCRFTRCADRRLATRLLDLAGSPLFVAEGTFAAEIVRQYERQDCGRCVRGQ